MSCVAKVGERLYEFENFNQLAKAREIYCNCTADQNTFEKILEEHGVDFYYELEAINS